METEFKYRLKDESVFNSMLKDAELRRNRTEDAETIEMKAAYFDTEFQDLRHRGVAYRIRKENERINATVKWDLDVFDGMYVREEINLVVNDEAFADDPDIELFVSSSAYDVLSEATQGRKLVKNVEMEYTRRQFLVDTGKSLSCISEDQGVIHCLDGHDEPIFELEIEWYHGDEEDYKELASRIQKQYGLEIEDRSKLQRAFS